MATKYFNDDPDRGKYRSQHTMRKSRITTAIWRLRMNQFWFVFENSAFAFPVVIDSGDPDMRACVEFKESGQIEMQFEGKWLDTLDIKNDSEDVRFLAFVVAHEALHVTSGHFARFDAWFDKRFKAVREDPDSNVDMDHLKGSMRSLANIVMDLFINEMLMVHEQGFKDKLLSSKYKDQIITLEGLKKSSAGPIWEKIFPAAAAGGLLLDKSVELVMNEYLDEVKFDPNKKDGGGGGKGKDGDDKKKGPKGPPQGPGGYPAPEGEPGDGEGEGEGEGEGKGKTPGGGGGGRGGQIPPPGPSNNPGGGGGSEPGQIKDGRKPGGKGGKPGDKPGDQPGGPGGTPGGKGGLRGEPGDEPGGMSPGELIDHINGTYKGINKVFEELDKTARENWEKLTPEEKELIARLMEEKRQNATSGLRGTIDPTVDPRKGTRYKGPESSNKKHAGNYPLGELRKSIPTALQDTEAWKTILRQFVARIVNKTQEESTFRRKDNSMTFLKNQYPQSFGKAKLPNRHAQFPMKAPRLLIYVDTSGSMGGPEIGYIDAILRKIPKHVEVKYYSFDHSVYDANDFAEAVRKMKGFKFRGGGGTDIGAVSQHFSDMVKKGLNVDGVIVFTDGYFGTAVIKQPNKWLFMITPGGSPAELATMSAAMKTKLRYAIVSEIFKDE